MTAPYTATAMLAPDIGTATDASREFIALLERALAAGTFVKLVLAKSRVAADDLVRVTLRPIVLKGEAQLSFVFTHRTRDVTKNLHAADGVAQVRALLAGSFSHAHLFTGTGQAQLMISKKGRQTLLHAKAPDPSTAPDRPAHAEAPSIDVPSHDREKHRLLTLDRAFLGELGITKPDPLTARPRLVPAMARKWKQINKFIEVLDHALDASGLKPSAPKASPATGSPAQPAPPIAVADFGSGKGYLTFAMHDHLRHALGLNAQVSGVELRDDMVSLCNAAVQRLGLDGLHFERGDVSSVAPRPIDIMVALHACDTATDHAIHTGLRAGAAIIMCSPCCHKELRPQLLSPHPMRPILKHGVHLGQQAEMLTDGLRAMLLDACGYDTQVFEFIALEHTHKNKMILAVKRTQAKPSHQPAAEVWQQIDDIKSFYGIRDQCLETLLKTDRAAQLA